mgnify:CR=1 FL=1
MEFSKENINTTNDYIDLSRICQEISPISNNRKVINNLLIMWINLLNIFLISDIIKIYVDKFK